MKKIIKPVRGYSGYFVSNYGEMYSKWEGGGNNRRIGECLNRLKCAYSDGRVQVNLSKNKKRISKRVHRIVLEAFVGPCPEGMEACHFPDRDTRNNRLDNLRWDTKASNHRDRVVHGTDNTGEKNGSAKLTWEKVAKIRAERASTTYRVLAEKYNVSLSAIQQVCERKTWRDNGCKCTENNR